VSVLLEKHNKGFWISVFYKGKRRLNLGKDLSNVERLRPAAGTAADRQLIWTVAGQRTAETSNRAWTFGAAVLQVSKQV
jgi:hypothetical protein